MIFNEECDFHPPPPPPPPPPPIVTTSAILATLREWSSSYDCHLPYSPILLGSHTYVCMYMLCDQ